MEPEHPLLTWIEVRLLECKAKTEQLNAEFTIINARRNTLQDVREAFKSLKNKGGE